MIMMMNTKSRGRSLGGILSNGPVVLRLVAFVVVVASGFLLSGCGQNLAADPEDLSVGIAKATYERDAAVLSRYPAPSLEQAMGADDERSLQDAAWTQLSDESVPQGSLQADGVQQLAVPFVPAGVSFYDVPSTGPSEENITATVALAGTENDDYYQYCAVAVRPAGADPYDDVLFEFVLGSQDSCGM